MNRIEKIYSILSTTITQLSPSDDVIISDHIKEAHFLAREEMENHLWQTKPPTHRYDVLIKTSDGRFGIGWFSQGENGATLNVEYLASRDPKPSLDAELSAQCVTHWKPLD